MNKGTKWLIAALAVFAVGITAGGFFAIKAEPTLLSSYFAELSGGEISIRTFEAALSALAVWTVLFFSAFFKFGAVTTALTIVYRGFVDGYSVTAILRILGIKGLPLCFFDILGVPLALLMAANVMCVLTDNEKSGGAYVVRSIILLAASLLAAVLSSFPAGWIMPKILANFNF